MEQKAQSYGHKVSLRTEWLTISAQFLILKTETALRTSSMIRSKMRPGCSKTGELEEGQPARRI